MAEYAGTEPKSVQVGGAYVNDFRKYPELKTAKDGAIAWRFDFPRRSSSIVSKRMSGADPFFDTSVLLYLLSDDTTKADKIETLLSAREFF